MKIKTVFFWGCLCVFLSACVYFSLPKADKPKFLETPENKTDQIEEVSSPEIDYEAIVEAYFASRPVRDVPNEADFSSFLVATYAKNNKDFSKTADMYAQVLNSDPENKEIKETLYQYYVLSGKVEKAVEYGNLALDENKENLLPQLLILADKVYHKKYQEASDMLQNLNAGGNTFLGPLLKAWILVGLGEKEKAYASLETLKKDDSLYIAYLLHKGMMSDYFSQTQQAATCYDELLKRDAAKNVRVLLLLKEFETRTRGLKDKKTFALNYASVQDESFISKEMLSSPDNSAVSKGPEQGVAWVLFDLASAMGQIKDLDLALYFAQLALYLNPESSVIQLFIGEILEEQQLLTLANNFYQKISPEKNIFLSVQLRTIMNQIKMGDVASAITSLNALFTLFPNGALLHMTLGDAYRANDNYEMALQSYIQATNLANPKDAQTSLLYFYQGICYERLGRLDEASAFFEKALMLNPSNPVYLNYAGYTWLEQKKNIPEALNLIKRAVEMVPNDGAILDSLGWAYYLMGEYETALGYLEKAVELQAGNAVLNSHLGDVYWRLGRYREARFQWSHASTLKEENSENLKAQLAEKIEKGLPLPSAQMAIKN